MDFLKSSLNSQSGHKPNNDSNSQPDAHHAATDHPAQTKPDRQPSTSELMSSAKLVAEAAKATMGSKSSEVDKAKVAEAAADLLDAAEHYGKIEKTSGLGKYMDQAESYLHKYGSSHPGGVEAGKKKEEEKGHGGGGGGSGSGHDYFKMAEGFLKK
ncbi:hypothetical protein QQ045_020484 [Rhodiola kirilowii]